MPRKKTLKQPPNLFRCFDSSPEVIRLVIMMYVEYPLSLRNVEDLRYCQRKCSGAGSASAASRSEAAVVAFQEKTGETRQPGSLPMSQKAQCEVNTSLGYV